MNLSIIADYVCDYVFPERCVLCGGYLAARRAGKYPVCGPCVKQFSTERENRCRVCSQPLISEKELCMKCRARTYNFESNFSLFMYHEPRVMRLVIAYKGQGRRSLAAFFAERLLAVYSSLYEGLPIVPVPCRKQSLRKRGFDQIALLCREMKRRAPVRVLPLLRRMGKTREQKTLNREERQKNLLGAIIPAPGTLRRFGAGPPEAVVLLDDVFTTGATVDACAGVLKSLGIRQVYVLTLAMD